MTRATSETRGRQGHGPPPEINHSPNGPKWLHTARSWDCRPEAPPRDPLPTGGGGSSGPRPTCLGQGEPGAEAGALEEGAQEDAQEDAQAQLPETAGRRTSSAPRVSDAAWACANREQFIFRLAESSWLMKERCPAEQSRGVTGMSNGTRTSSSQGKANSRAPHYSYYTVVIIFKK